MSTSITSLQSALQSLPPDASEAIVSSNFSPVLLQALGFEPLEIIPEYDTGGGRVDKAARKNVRDDIFLHTRSNPYLLLELKGRRVNLDESTPSQSNIINQSYSRTVNQLKQQLLGSKCESVQWGIINNSSHIQLFRKHGKTIFPATQCLTLNFDNVDEIVASIRQKIEETSRALTVTVYNNQGGVGKTTTTVNLAAILAFEGKKVLVIDFDLNQQDLTGVLGIPVSQGKIKEALTDKNIELTSVVYTRKYSSKRLEKTCILDVIPADNELQDDSTKPGGDLKRLLSLHTLYNKLHLARQQYDYILIDASPNWRFTTQLAIYAADVILIPTKYNHFSSLRNAATAIKKFIPEMQEEKRNRSFNGSPIALPIFFNGEEEVTPPQLEAAKKSIKDIIETSTQEGFNLLPYFHPKHTDTQDLDLKDICTVRKYAAVSGSAFLHIPAVYRNSQVRISYEKLAREYFIQ